MIGKFLVTGLLASACLAAACAPVTGERILGRDLAIADPVFGDLPPSLLIGLAPLPGEKRIVDSTELARIARANGIATTALNEVCFELPLRQISRQEVAAAMLQVLPQVARLEIVEMGKADAPAGEIEFPLQGMEPADTGGNRVWRGWVRYSSTRKMRIWAKVRVLEEYTAIFATRDLTAGSVLDTSWFGVETRTGPMPPEPLAKAIRDVQGMVLKRSLKSGATVPVSLLAPRLAIRRGDKVRVNVASGWARLRFEAIAESDAREGDQIALRNPATGKTFRARVEGNGKATVVIGGPTL